MANKKPRPYRKVWLHCSGKDWTYLLQHLSARLPATGSQSRWSEWRLNSAVNQTPKGKFCVTFSVCLQRHSLCVLWEAQLGNGHLSLQLSSGLGWCFKKTWDSCSARYWSTCSSSSRPCQQRTIIQYITDGNSPSMWEFSSILRSSERLIL